MVTSVNSSLTSPASAATNSSSTSSAVANAITDNGLGENAFLKILMAQIQNQDPLQPMDDTTFVTQLAQFSSLEQQVSTNQLLQTSTANQQAQLNTQDASLVGQVVTVSGATTTLGGTGVPAPIGFTLGTAAQSVTVNITDSSGNPVDTMTLGAAPAGPVQTTWNGLNSGGTSEPAGTYTIAVTAKDANGNSVVVSQQSTGVVQSVSFGSGGATLVLNNGVSAAASSLISVGQ
jgi:flagellar basal-body rod modification protein FlgD